MVDMPSWNCTCNASRLLILPITWHVLSSARKFVKVKVKQASGRDGQAGKPGWAHLGRECDVHFSPLGLREQFHSLTDASGGGSWLLEQGRRYTVVRGRDSFYSRDF